MASLKYATAFSYAYCISYSVSIVNEHNTKVMEILYNILLKFVLFTECYFKCTCCNRKTFTIFISISWDNMILSTISINLYNIKSTDIQFALSLKNIIKLPLKFFNG